MGDDRPARYLEGDRVIYRASSLGACERALVALASNHQPRPHPQWFQDVLDEGTKYEATIAMLFAGTQGDPDDPRDFRNEGWIDQFEGEFEVGTIQGREVVVRYHADDVYLDDDDPKSAILREYKKFRDSTWPKFLSQGVECNANYPWQIAVMMHSLKEQGYDVFCQFIGGHFDGQQIVEVDHKVLLDPPIPRIAIIKKIARVERLIAEGLVPDEVPCQVRFPCGFWYLHDEKPEVETVELVDSVQLAALADWHTQQKILKAAREMTETAEKKKRAAAEVLAAVAGDGVVVAGQVDGTRVLVKHHVQQVEARTQEVKAHTRDYFQEVK